ncbi:MAG: hypothetical protein K8U03_15870 [Planctomycetia bacterium]|nr:hypothetical protein [Planctomycetia bacterium]
MIGPLLCHGRRLFAAAAIVCCGAGFVAAQTAASPKFENLDVNEDGVLSGSELKSVSGRDKNGDGRVTPAEFAPAAEPAQPDPLNSNTKSDEKKFAELDVTEDEFLSGRELRGVEAYDVDRNGRVTKEEYLQGAAAARRKAGVPAPVAPITSLPVALALPPLPPLPPLPQGTLPALPVPQPKAPAGATSDLDPLVWAFQTGAIQPLLSSLNERGRSCVDAPVLQFAVDAHRKEYGDIVAPKVGDVTVVEQNRNGVVWKTNHAEAAFTRGKVALFAVTAGGAIEDADVISQLMDEIPKRYSAQLLVPEGEALAGKTTDHFGPQGERLLRLILTGKDREAFECFFWETRDKLGFETLAAYFAQTRAALGTVEKIECTGVAAETDADGKVKPTFDVQYELTSSIQGTVKGWVSFQIVGLKARLMTMQLKKAEEK